MAVECVEKWAAPFKASAHQSSTSESSLQCQPAATQPRTQVQAIAHYLQVAFYVIDGQAL